MKDFYRTLGVARNATQDEIKKAFRALARQHHPDINRSPLAESRFKELNEAYEVMGDPVKRALYDLEKQAQRRIAGRNARTFHRPPYTEAGHGGFAGHSYGYNPQGQDSYGQDGQPRDYEVRLPLSLEDAAFGGLHDISVDLPELGRCQNFQVDIPRGSRPGQKIRIPRGGGCGADSRLVGDLFLVIEVTPHPRFRLDGCDLHTILDIAPWEAVLGSKVEMTTLDGRVLVQIPPYSSSGRKIRLRGKGFPGRNGSPDGDMLVELRIVVPERLSDYERGIFEELAKHCRFRPRG